MRQFRKFYNLVLRASASRNIFGQLLDLVLHKVLVNIGPRDYYFYEFYKKAHTWQQKSRYVCNRGSHYWIYENNPFKYQVLFTDKYVQKLLLTGLCLPTPALLALVDAHGAVSTLDAFAAAVVRAPDEFVLKRVSGSGGQGFRKFTKSQGEIFEGNDAIQLEDLWNSLQQYLQRGILMEETAHNNDIIRRMNPSSLNTFRVLTFRFPDTGWVPIGCYLRVGRQNSAVDNNGAGGLLVRIDDTGRTGRALECQTKTWGEYSDHPDSGATLAGILIDGFADVLKLAEDGSVHFSQMGLLGWDIALTKNGPVIIEVNASPLCEYLQVAEGGVVTDEMAKVLKPRHMFSRYRKTHMFPSYNRKRKGLI